jgi:hypothetical protein
MRRISLWKVIPGEILKKHLYVEVLIKTLYQSHSILTPVKAKLLMKLKSLQSILRRDI